MTEGKLTERGWVETRRIGDLVFTYRTGKDAPKDTPVFDMSVGDVAVENVGTREIELRYSVPLTFFEGHLFELGAAQERTFKFPHTHWTGPEDEMVYTSRPGRRGKLSRRDYMDLYHRLGRAQLIDGTMRTQYSAAISIDGTIHQLEFGPRLFVVDLDRDWDQEMAKYIEFFAARDRGEIPR